MIKITKIYKETGYFESNGKKYDMNKIFEKILNKKSVLFFIKDLEWILEYDNPNIKIEQI